MRITFYLVRLKLLYASLLNPVILCTFYNLFFNCSPVKDTIVVNDRWGTDANCKHGDVKLCKDRYSPSTSILCQILISGGDSRCQPPWDLLDKLSTQGLFSIVFPLSRRQTLWVRPRVSGLYTKGLEEDKKGWVCQTIFKGEQVVSIKEEYCRETISKFRNTLGLKIIHRRLIMRLCAMAINYAPI